MSKNPSVRRVTLGTPTGEPLPTKGGIARFEVVYQTSEGTLVYLTITYTKGNQSVKQILEEIGVNIDDAVVRKL